MSDIFDLFRKISDSPATPKAPISFVVAGLGNPGKEYENTRHNMGFMTVDRLASACGTHIDRARFHGLTAEATVGNARVLLLKPLTYMNNSGIAVAEALRFYKLPPENLIVLCDDISFEPGRMRIRLHGSAGGHNGLKSIIEMTGSENFIRIKLGVGQKPHPDYDLADWVLGKFPESAVTAVSEAQENAVSAVRELVNGNTDAAMRYSK